MAIRKKTQAATETKTTETQNQDLKPEKTYFFAKEFGRYRFPWCGGRIDSTVVGRLITELNAKVVLNDGGKKVVFETPVGRSEVVVSSVDELMDETTRIGFGYPGPSGNRKEEEALFAMLSRRNSNATEKWLATASNYRWKPSAPEGYRFSPSSKWPAGGGMSFAIGIAVHHIVRKAVEMLGGPDQTIKAIQRGEWQGISSVPGKADFLTKFFTEEMPEDTRWEPAQVRLPLSLAPAPQKQD